MAKITRIKASDPGQKAEKASEKPVKAVSKPAEAKVRSSGGKTGKAPEKASDKADIKAAKATKKSEKKPFILIRPFVYFGRYIRESFAEIKLVRWPSRKATWKLVLAIFVYTAIFIALIMLLDALFTWLFGLIIG